MQPQPCPAGNLLRTHIIKSEEGGEFSKGLSASHSVRAEDNNGPDIGVGSKGKGRTIVLIMGFFVFYDVLIS